MKHHKGVRGEKSFEGVRTNGRDEIIKRYGFKFVLLYSTVVHERR